MRMPSLGLLLVLLAAASLLSTTLTGLVAASLYPPASSLDSADASLDSRDCYATAHAGMIALLCEGASDGSLGKDCCSSLLLTADKGGLHCLCQAVASPDLVSSGFTLVDVLRWYTACGGRRLVNETDLVATCHDRVVFSSAVTSSMDLSTPTPPGTQFSQGIPPPPPPTVTFQEPKVLLVEQEPGHHPSAWPWVILSLGVLALIAVITWICCMSCEMIIKLVIDMGMWVFNLARNQAPARVGTEGTTSTVPDIMAEPLPPLINLAEDADRASGSTSSLVPVAVQPEPVLPPLTILSEDAKKDISGKVYPDPDLMELCD